MTDKKSYIKILSMLFAVLFLLIFFVNTTNVSAYSYPEIRFGENVSGNLSDTWGGSFYQFNVNEKSNVRINYSSTQSSNFCLYNSKWTTILKLENLNKTSKLVNLDSGNYIIGIYNNTYNNGSYQLRLNKSKKDNKPPVKPEKNVAFTFQNYYLNLGSSVKLPIVKNPKDLKNSDISWSSSKPKVVRVTKNGKVKGLKMGKSIITARIDNKRTSCTAFVNKKTISVLKGKRKTLPKINGKRVKWTSKNTAIAKVIKKSVKGVSAGYAVVTANVDGVTYYVNVYVS